MEFRLHGANPEKLYELFGLPMPERLYDFSTNTNAVAQRGGFAPDLRAALEDYPDDECLALRALLAEVTEAAPENILVTSGSNESIYLIASYEAARENRILQPVYGEYLRALKNFGAAPLNIFDLRAAKLPAEGAVWLCNPCNPTGGFIPDGELDEIAARHPRTLFIVDEAYRDFIWTDEALAPYRPRPNVVRLRSLTKTYNLCGARIGYILADAEMTERLRRRQPSWSVSGLAQQAALFFLADATLLRRTKDYYAAEMPRLISAVNVAGFPTLPSCVNYFLAAVDDDEKFIRFLLERGIVVRHTRNFPGLDGRYVRIAARTRPENDILLAAMEDYR
ncbi:aminotransferase class I/II-fold pyridoxal phosphate-dependent enzyme [Cloacibacillus porcorum]|uniref:pyridoxal phosphate-dependent aminotransferase n=1 Tax=Cloacibacillus porcorum TaxID=1197717 RepID=UPI001459ABEE|nr:aminotransferase class I/II-fold pyridoxal phosphate-dependent enzyme [Cloacibacillus porcorum]MCC8185392.1 aminotransferase class I/II-fold pyridoxal phosphate-dependent enzyme [Cloacibacillus porcorum]MDY5391175.1 aminotransferase class I/II-fold pyridoxal phosphate-dependent enzyme [Cloacibacillus porcorum]NMF19337.1 aminotransferase class I/II-fold pyridoxal phosphate-dependent enzyme [Cloacibacillus porcorum]